MPPVPKKTRPLRAIGLTCGIGSMLVGARQAGFEVVGNIEWRRYYHYRDAEGRNTFTENFPGAVMKYQLDELTEGELDRFAGADLAMGHPECGLYSQMQGCNNFRSPTHREDKMNDPGDIPLFIDMLARLRPRFFVMDDLPKSFVAYPMEEYSKKLPDYDLFPEWVSNWGYGNIQKRRDRLFMIGALKTERFVFRPGESEHRGTIASVLTGLDVDPDGSIYNHDVHSENDPCGRGLHMDYLWHRPTYGDLRKWFASRAEGVVFEYHSTSGGKKKKPGWYKQRWNHTCAVLDGGSGHIHPLRNLPFTIRERARVQGFPDDFLFYGTKLNGQGEWNHEKNIHMVKQTGKAMPVQFNRFISSQVISHINSTRFDCSEDRVIKPNPFVDQAKTWYCENVGYADQPGACKMCWLSRRCSIRTRILGIDPLLDTRGTVSQPTVGSTKRHTRISKRAVRIITPVAYDDHVEVVRIGDGLPKKRPEIEHVDIIPRRLPDDYHCDCRFCSTVIGELRRSDGTYYSRLDRKKYYIESESGPNGHVAKTPLHLARWAIQEYTTPGDWVLDPTVGAGTTIVESLIQGRSAAGMEIQFGNLVIANAKKYSGGSVGSIIGLGDARNLEKFLTEADVPPVSLIVNNPPYSGDEHQSTLNITDEDKSKGTWSKTFKYDHSKSNLAFLKEGDEYWSTMKTIYSAAIGHLTIGGRIVVGVKDMMRAKSPYLLHKMLCEVVESIGGVEFEGTAVLRHYPGTLFLNTYEKMYGVRPPLYQTINVFKRVK